MARISKDPAVRRQELLNVAQKLFIAKGYEGTSIRDILNEVGGAPGMFYYYFSSKEEIYKVAMTQYIDNYVARINIILGDRSLSIPDRIQNILHLIRTTFDEYLSASSGYNRTDSSGTDVMVSMKILNLVADSAEAFVVEAMENDLVKNSLVYQNNTRKLTLFILYGIYGILRDGSEAGLCIELIDKNMRDIIPFISTMFNIPSKMLMKGGE